MSFLKINDSTIVTDKWESAANLFLYSSNQTWGRRITCDDKDQWKEEPQTSRIRKVFHGAIALLTFVICVPVGLLCQMLSSSYRQKNSKLEASIEKYWQSKLVYGGQMKSKDIEDRIRSSLINKKVLHTPFDKVLVLLKGHELTLEIIGGTGCSYNDNGKTSALLMLIPENEMTKKYQLSDVWLKGFLDTWRDNDNLMNFFKNVNNRYCVPDQTVDNFSSGLLIKAMTDKALSKPCSDLIQ